MSTPSSVRSSFSRAVSLLRTARWMGARPEPSPSTSCLAPTRRSCAMNSAFRSSIAVSSRLRRKDVRRKLDPMPTYFAPPSAAGRFIQCATSSSPSSTSPTLIMSVKLLRSPAWRNMRAAACGSDMQLRLVILMHSARASNFPGLAIFTTVVAQFRGLQDLVISHGGHVHCLLSPVLARRFTELGHSLSQKVVFTVNLVCVNLCLMEAQGYSSDRRHCCSTLPGCWLGLLMKVP